MDLLDIARRIVNGEKSAWEEFLPAFYEIGHRTLYTFRLPEDDQNEILSQVLYKLFSGGLKKFRGGSKGELAMYLKRTIRNQALTVVTKARSHEVSSDALNDMTSDSALLEDRAADEECLRLLERIVQSLSTLQRQGTLFKDILGPKSR